MDKFVVHNTQKVTVNRGLFGILKVLAAWFVLSGVLGIAADLVTLPIVRSCLPNSSSRCLAQRRTVDGVGNLAGMVGAGLMVSWKLNNDAKRRYQELPESEREADG